MAARLRPARPRSKRAVNAAAVLHLLGHLIHSADHVARRLELTPTATFWLGTTGLLPASLIQLPPHRSAFSEPSRVGVGDWLTLVAMVGGAIASRSQASTQRVKRVGTRRRAPRR
jgi:hypothetical protein